MDIKNDTLIETYFVHLIIKNNLYLKGIGGKSKTTFFNLVLFYSFNYTTSCFYGFKKFKIVFEIKPVSRRQQ